MVEWAVWYASRTKAVNKYTRFSVNGEDATCKVENIDCSYKVVGNGFHSD